ncbi:hypothetical protein ACFE04_020820 [Oxalis oulophora]
MDTLRLSHQLGLSKLSACDKYKVIVNRSSKLQTIVPSPALFQQTSYPTIRYSYKLLCGSIRTNPFRSHASLTPAQGAEIPLLKAASTALTKSYNALQGAPVIVNLLPAIGISLLALWGLEPLVRQCRTLLFNKSDSNWKKSKTYKILTSYIQPLMLWTGAILVCRALEPIALPTDANQVVKNRLLNFIRSLSTVLAFAYCLSSVIQQTQKYFVEASDSTDARNMGYQFAGKAVYSAVWVAAVSLFMELLGFSTKKWLTAGGLGTVLLTLAGREIFTNFLSSVMIHATRPFVVNQWIQTKIEGYEVSGTVEHVGWWSPTIIRGEDREAIHIPNHKFTVNIVRNLTQKTHWRIKTHLAISHLDNIVADMRKILAKNPQVEQQRLHRRVFLDKVDPENQALSILVSCFVKTSHHEEYLRVKEVILLDLLKVISHHGARLATPIRTVQKTYSDAEFDSAPFVDPGRRAKSNRPLLLVEPPYKINGENKTNFKTRTSGEQEIKSTTTKPSPDAKADSKVEATTKSDSKAKETPKVDGKGKAKIRESPNSSPTKENLKAETTFSSGLTNGDDSASEDSGFLENSQMKQDGFRSAGPQTSTPRAALDENIVLDVALQGSKRTLPVEEESTPVVAEAKELAAVCGNQNGSPCKATDQKENI